MNDSLFVECPTVADLKTFLAGEDSTESYNAVDTPSDRDQVIVGDESITILPLAYLQDKNYPTVEVLSVSSESQSNTEEHQPLRSATSVVLQGSLKTANKILFLLPDGSGSATSYASIPRLGSDICLVGLNSPYMKDPEALRTCSLDELVGGYLLEIRRRQANGPYDLGGWSAGGILAFRATQMLCEQGEQVLSLVLIDSPTPQGLDRLPQHFYDFCDSLSLFGNPKSGGRPDWLVPHFNATIDVLHEYFAEPLLEHQCPKVTIVWACETVTEGPGIPPLPPHPDDTEGMKFITEKRRDFSPNGWEDLFPKTEITITRVKGAHHFSMMALE
ncbi:hypothetical protein CHU98_g2180 [Xylaria longipes]|nr:hypothetical protein CHU98_g2180 [Xylaria longipes]